MTPLGDESSIDSVSTATKQSFAFTIDNFNDKDCDPAAAAAKYKNMLERFQNRHRRGTSMGKLESTNGKDSALTSPVATSLTKAQSIENNQANTNISKQNDNEMDAVPKVKLRVRDRSTSRVRDSNKRHSWSPRSSTNELTTTATAAISNSSAANKLSNQTQAQIKNRLDAMPPQGSTRKVTKNIPPPLQLPKSNLSVANNRAQQQQQSQPQHFTPRSTAMQMALQKVDFLCLQPPLTDFNHLNIDGDDISETGTYTLDGDNYTEEQKDLMNIDSKLQKARKAGKTHNPNRPTELDIPSADTHFITKIPVTTSSRNNILEVNFYHDPTPVPIRTNANDFMHNSHQSATSYLEKIKSRVLRNMSATKNVVQQIDNASSEKPMSSDVGTFTSVTTSGVLAKQSALDPRPKLTRRSSLSTSQIDSSEYVSNESKLKNSGVSVYSGGGFTDHQKAEYRLNVFTNQKESQKFAPNRSFIETPPESPSVFNTNVTADQTNMSDTAILKTAQNKNDWIQEWARNARARSLANETKKNRQIQVQELMTRSYTCSEAGESLTDDSLFNSQRSAVYNKSLAERYRLVGEIDYSSDPAISSSYSPRSNADTSIQKPPKSPSKIPSPLHSIGRARSASRTRSSLQNMMQQDAAEAESYLQKTAAAINNLQQSLSRKSSLQSPHHSGSPRMHTNNSHTAYYSPDEYSPQHSLNSPTGDYQPTALRNVHKRNLSMESYNRDKHSNLMTSSFNEQQLKLLSGAGGDYNMHMLRGRKNSFDGNLQLLLHASPGSRKANWSSQQSAREASKRTRNNEQVQAQENALSPLRRSSSFSAKVATARAARPQFQNLYTPPAARHNYVPPPHENQRGDINAIKKSASSNNFGNVYSDYDENLAYYIKDEDDYENVEDYCSSGDDLEIHEDYDYNVEVADARDEPNPVAVPLSNTRYNKALLMRIERSKQKVTGGGLPSAGSVKTVIGGVVACPNTPEMPRRSIKSAPRSNAARQSMPRDSSLNRLAGQIPNSLASAKKQILQTAAAVPANSGSRSTSVTGRVQPKYLDISKYKPAQGNNFLRKNDAKSTLKSGGVESMKRSPSSSSMGISRGDPTRASNRSTKSVASVMTASGTSLSSSARGASAVRRDTSGISNYLNFVFRIL